MTSKPGYVKAPIHPWFAPGPFRTASSFSSAAFLDRFLRGQGGRWMDYEKRYIERIQSQGIVGRRVPCEATYWDDRDDNAENDHPFFNEDRATSLRTWDYNALRRGERPGANRELPALTVHMQKYLLFQIGLAREFDIKTEFVIDWTLKHSPGVGWNVIGHCIRQTAAFLRLVDIGKWDTGADGNAIGHPTNPEANDAIRALFERVKGPMRHLVAFELHNEFSAHSRDAWVKDGLSPEAALAEVNAQLERTKRIKNGQPEQWPEGACWVSHGGQDDIEYNPQHADAVALHPSRPSTRVGDRFRHLRKYGKPIYANEILHYIDPSMWWLVENGTFRPGSSTKDTADRMRFVDEMLDDGMWVCEHSLTGMANGRWKDVDSDYEEMPLDAYEKARGGQPSPGPTPPPAPDPAPEPDPKPEPSGDLRVVGGGSNFISIQLPAPIVVDVERDGNDPYRREFHVELPRDFEVYAVDSFFGHDRGDAYEMAVEVFSDVDASKVAHARDFLFRRIDEDTAPGSAGSELYELPAVVRARALKVLVLCRVTGANTLVHDKHPSENKWRGVFDFNLLLVGR